LASIMHVNGYTELCKNTSRETINQTYIDLLFIAKKYNRIFKTIKEWLIIIENEKLIVNDLNNDSQHSKEITMGILLKKFQENRKLFKTLKKDNKRKNGFVWAFELIIDSDFQNDSNDFSDFNSEEVVNVLELPALPCPPSDEAEKHTEHSEHSKTFNNEKDVIA